MTPDELMTATEAAFPRATSVSVTVEPWRTEFQRWTRYSVYAVVGAEAFYGAADNDPAEAIRNALRNAPRNPAHGRP